MFSPSQADQTRPPLPPDSPASVWKCQVEGFLSFPPSKNIQAARWPGVCVQVPEAELEYWLFLQLSV